MDVKVKDCREDRRAAGPEDNRKKQDLEDYYEKMDVGKRAE